MSDHFNCDGNYRFIPNANLPVGFAEIQVGWIAPDVEMTAILDLSTGAIVE